MVSRVLILGTDHRFQRRSPEFTDQKHRAFGDMIRQVVSEYGAKAIAEENNRQAILEAGTDHSVLELIAQDLGVVHKFCDPDRVTRASLDISQENEIRLAGFFGKLPESEVQARVEASHVARERVWLEELNRLAIWPALFVCGANHAKRFEGLLQLNGVRTSLLANDWDA